MDVLDNEIFAALSPTKIERYLANTGWRESRRTPGEVSIWEKESSGDNKVRVWVPLNQEFGDYNESVSRLVKAVSAAENRSQLYLLEDLDTVAVGDVVRVKTRDRYNKASSSILMDVGFTLFTQAERMTSAAACAVFEKRAVFPVRRPTRVIEYMRDLRIGQTERSSYVIKLISPINISPIKDEADEHSLFEMASLPLREDPFERRVIISLMESLDALYRISNEAKRRGLFYIEGYQEGISAGISANLCEAISLAPNGGLYNPIEISVNWSYAIKPPSNGFLTYTFEPEVMPYIVEAAYQLRLRNPEEVTLKGFITTLRRKKIGDPNIVTLYDGSKNVRITLSEADYNEAIHAHENDAPVSVNGVLKKEGNFYTLENPENFHIVSTGGRSYQPELDFE